MLKFCENKLRIRANYTSNFLQIHKLILNKEKTELIILQNLEWKQVKKYKPEKEKILESKKQIMLII